MPMKRKSKVHQIHVAKQKKLLSVHSSSYIHMKRDKSIEKERAYDIRIVPHVQELQH